MRKSILLLLALALASSCATSALWDTTDPYVAVSQGDISEDALKAQNVRYYRDDFRKVIFVEKRGMAKFKDYAIRTLATPVTVVIDAATTIVVVGAIGGACVLYCVGQGDGYSWQP